MHALGLLTPALTAVHMAHVSAADIELATRTGIAVALCPEEDVRASHGLAPVSAWAKSGLRLCVGSRSTAAGGGGANLWPNIRLLALLSHVPDDTAVLGAWDALAIATRGGAAALGLDAEIGTLQPGKWADLCCVDLSSPAMASGLEERAADPAADAAARLVFDGGRSVVSDVWVAGRQLLDAGAFTRLDWPAVAVRMRRRFTPINGG